VVVDGPATGHFLRLLRAPRQLLAMVPPDHSNHSAQTPRTLADPGRTQVLVVTIPDEMAVNEAIEAKCAVADDLALRLTVRC